LRAVDECHNQSQPLSVECEFADHFNASASCTATVDEYLACFEAQ
jgi:hypothetical protein